MKTPLSNAIQQSNLDASGFKITGADLSDYVGAGMSWNTGTKKFETTGLDENTVTGREIGLVGDGLTDNTTVLQTWLDSTGTAQVNTTLLVEDGVYVFSGALQDPGRQNAQILLPQESGVPPWTLTIKGYHPLSPTPTPAPYGPAPVGKGPVFKSTLATGGGTQPSFIGGMGAVGWPFDQNGLHLRFENMIFETVANPLISCLDFSHQTWVEMAGDIIIVAGEYFDEVNSVQPTTTTSYGLILPNVNIGVLETLESVHIFGFYTGYRTAELALIQALCCYFCNYSVEFPFAYHPTLIQRLLDYHCPYGLNVIDSCPFSIQQMDIERGAPGEWNERVYDVVDAANHATADITWWAVQGNVGVVNTFTLNGGTGIKARRIGGAY